MSAQSGQSPSTLKVVMAQLDFLVGDIPGNTRKVIEAAQRAETELAADIVVFPELCLTGYPPEDLLLRPSMDLRISEALDTLTAETLGPAIVVGAPIRHGALLYNAALVIDRGAITARYFKRFPPNYQVFDEKRYFADGRDVLVQDIRGVSVGLTV
jgi:NAD+ synthase (glutamine-hydrolysing)